MAAAIGIGIDVLEPVGNMIIDIGGGTSEIAVIALGGIVCNKSIRIAGDEFNQDIIDYMRKQHNIHIGERMAEKIKIAVGAAIPELSDPSFAPACSAASLTALSSTLVIPLGMQITILSEGGIMVFFMFIILISSRIMSFAISKSAITPSRNGLMVFIAS